MVKRISCSDKIEGFPVSVACIGYFDGVHLGHQELIRKTLTEADRKGCRPLLIGFEPDPLQLIKGNSQKHILSYQKRLKHINDAGISDIIIFDFDAEFMKIDAISFIRDYLEHMNITELICGFDFSFGYKALGNVELLQKQASFAVNVIPEITYQGEKISSTRIKQAISSGDLELAGRLLGYDYYLLLKVNKVTQNGYKWAIEATLKDDSCIIPQNINELFDDIRYQDQIFYMNRTENVQPGDEIKLVFNDERDI